MTAKQMFDVVGKTGFLVVDSLRFPVEIEDCRKVFNRIDVEIKPIGSKGSQWVALDRVAIN